MRRLKIGIRSQLIIIVCFASLFSLLILGIVTGIYFSVNLKNLRLERLLVISQLKRTQVQQAIQYIAYQVMTVSEIDSLTVPLSNYRAGNNSKTVFSEAQNYLQQYVLSTDSFISARLYDLDLQVVASSFDNMTLISDSAQDVVYPLRQNASIPQVLDTQSGLFFTGPIANNSENFNSMYFMGITVPVLSNSSIILSQPSISGYLTIIASAESIRSALNSTSEDDYQAMAVEPVYGDPQQGIDNLQQNTYNGANQVIGFKLVFPVQDSLLEAGAIYNINSSSSMKTALASNSGTATSVKSFFGKKVSIGFSRISVQDNLNWSIVIVQSSSVFNGPANKLRRITIGVVIGIGAFMCLVTFPLAVWFIRPITKLKEATEAITKYKKEKLNNVNSNGPNSSTGSDSPNQPLLDMGTGMGKRNSINSSSISSSYSTGIRLPARIPRSKKIFKDELTELSEAFNIMTEELDKQYTHLEDRVKSRTKELEASKIEAESANEAKTVFIANISHELRTPLNGILGMTSIAMEEEDPNRIHDSLKLIHRSGELLLHILTELLTYSKNTLNRSKLEKSNFQILEIVYQVRSIFNKLAHDQRVNFKILVKPNIFRKLIIYGDSNRIIQIVMNLVSNSLKFTPVDGSVGVSFKLLGEYDHEKSKKLDYKKVCILNDSSTSTVVPPPAPPSDTKPTPKKSHIIDHNNRSANTTSPLTPVGKPTNTKTSKGDTNNTINKDMKVRKRNNNNKKRNHNNNTNSDVFKNRRLSGSQRFSNIQEEELSPTAIDTDVDKYLTSSTDSDNISVTTLSTAQYETTIFESQFKSKPLPKLPIDAKSQLSEKVEDNDMKEIINDDEEEDVSGVGVVQVDDDDEDTVNEKQGNSSSSSTSNSTNEKQEEISPVSNNSTTVSIIRPRHNMMPSAQDFKSYPTFDKKPEYDSNMSNNEIVKNNRVFRIRNMYQPKVWVIQIEVTDTGPGIEPALQEKVFEPFVQGDQTLSRSYGGTGLGLSICRQLATMMHGTLTLKSTIGKGSTFTLTLPLPQTGEIMVPPEDMAEFCEDEFNPAAKINRKVAFDDDGAENNNDNNNNNDDDDDDDDERLQGQEQEKTSREDTNEKQNVQSSHTFNISSSSTSSLPPNSSSSDSPLPTSDSSDIYGGVNKSETGNYGNNEVAKKRVISTSSSLSTEGSSSKHNIGNEGNHGDDNNKNLTLTIDKPSLFTRGSTGTANSGTTSSHSDKKSSYPFVADHTTVLDDISHLRILVAEDNMVNQEVIKRMLRLEGLTNLTMACNGAEAIDFVKESIETNEIFDLIFMDVQMPKVDGLIATKMIRKNLQYNKPIIALTAFADESNVKECLNSGMSGFLAKPIRRTNLRKIIVEFLLNEVVTS
ncbi:histidine kinase, putative [Candida dubliniensis CD36]|uniref:histidine kinase n=1 Tax=Candida dubliniensis (strain CD36 / ATCC MYA-646 / CBS 7987 / NCPF 3949 / NRRL Y-17841) TaxID=573826 RepID=B9WKT5_CANDC|nr:histidine kinase, putative [Candida dubliniensis CD36]CAX39635.1 histidine kinase, putative [Candida dubliniensis CD36]